MITVPFKLDKEEISRLAALHGWRDVIEKATGLPIPDGRGKEFVGPCPVCNDPAADDRFRRHRDFAETGGVACRVCLPTKNSDGFAWISHVLKINFHETLKVVAGIVGYQPAAIAGPSSNKQAKQPVESNFKDGEWNEQLFGLWGLQAKNVKGIITREGIEKCGGVQSFHCSNRCIRIPVINDGETVGSVFVSMSGNFILGRDEKPVSKKTSRGCKNGYSGYIPEQCRILIKCEGYTDLLAGLSMDLPADVGIITNPFGCSDKPSSTILKQIASPVEEVWTIHDCDVPGQKGAEWFAGGIANFTTTKNIVLPFPVEPKQGKDLRDFIANGKGFPELSTLAESAKPVTPIDLPPGEDDSEFEILGLSEFIEQNKTLRTPLIDRLLRHGETCNIIAATKVGKSWMASDLAMSVATGSPWLKEFETKAGVVVYIDNELHPETLAHRFSEIRQFREFDQDKLNENLFPICLRGTGHDINSLASVLDSIKKDISLVVLDAWYRFIPPGTSENDNAEMMAMYNTLDGYAKTLDCSFLVVHHASKGDQGGKSITDVGSGAGAMSRAADSHIVIRPHEDEGLSVIHAATRSFAPLEPLSLFFTWPCWHRSLTEPKVRSQKSAKADQQRRDDSEAIKKIIADFANEEFTAGDCKTRLGINKDRATRILKNSDCFESTGFREPKQKNYSKQEVFKVRTETDQEEAT